ncbi:NAD(P)/FAD-dependent oxidoreductase [Paenibacillus yanchengensis]|uniref:NAD(P)/FAD-dependent oxidoreductase n=1 Tax=Paenibacillus yanchengensis TaxID=2035833 RepID=A0ABW4YI52_9BACL
MKKVIVVGAGILGASTAYQLTRLGADVLIVDRQDVGQATAAAAGIICPWLSQRRNKAWYRLAKAGASFYPSFIQQLEEEYNEKTGYAKVGALCLHTDIEKLEVMKKRAVERRVDAPEIGELTLLTNVEAKEKFPLLADGFHALHVAGAARVDGLQLRDALLRAAQQNGAELLTGSATLIHEGQTITGVSVDKQRFEADEVIVCAGAWSNTILHPLGINVQVDYQRAQIMHLQFRGQPNIAEWPVIIPPSDQYLLTLPDERIVIGATYENDVVDYDTAITVGGMQSILQKGLHIAPDLTEGCLLEIRVGFRPFTANYLPVFGYVEGWNKLIVANGLGSTGLTVGPYLGYQLAKLALQQQVDIPLEDYELALAAKK